MGGPMGGPVNRSNSFGGKEFTECTWHGSMKHMKLLPWMLPCKQDSLSVTYNIFDLIAVELDGLAKKN